MYLQEVDQRHFKTHTSGPKIKMSPLNSSVVLEQTLSGLGRDDQRRKTIPQWNSSGKDGILKGITIGKISSVL